MANKLHLTRNQLAAFLNDHESIKQFERLFSLANDIGPDGLNEVQVEAGTANAKADQALTALQRIADALELMATAPAIERNNSVVTDYIDLPENGPHVTQTRRVQWNADDGTMDVGLYGGSVLQVGQEIHYYAKNTSGGTIANGTPVMFTGSVGSSGKLTFAKAVADGSVDHEYMMGVATQDIANNAFGYVTSFGLVRGVDTSGTPYGETWADGDVIYFGPATAGTWTKVEPDAPNLALPVGVVITASSGANGSIFVRMKTGESLRELHDVYAPSPANNNVIVWNSTNSRWEATGVIVADLTNTTGRLVDSSVNLTNGAAASVGTLTNAPTAGNPTKWIPIDDNGTTRYIPAW